jgi:hypothetical protein
MGQRKNAVEIGCGQKLGFSIFKPTLSGYVLALGTMTIATGVITNPLSCTMITLFNVATKIRCTAIEKIVYDLILFRLKPMGFLII